MIQYLIRSARACLIFLWDSFQFDYCERNMSGKRCSPFGRGYKKAKPLEDQYNDQPANLWSAGGPKIESKTRIQADSDDQAGEGTVVAILDTGIQRNHRAFSNYDIEFEEKVVLCKNFVGGQEEEECDDLAGHGTQCAGLACGLSFEGVDEDGDLLPGNAKFNSSAPGAKLMVL